MLSPGGSAIAFLCKEIVRPIADVMHDDVMKYQLVINVHVLCICNIHTVSIYVHDVFKPWLTGRSIAQFQKRGSFVIRTESGSGVQQLGYELVGIVLDFGSVVCCDCGMQRRRRVARIPLQCGSRISTRRRFMIQSACSMPVALHECCVTRFIAPVSPVYPPFPHGSLPHLSVSRELQPHSRPDQSAPLDAQLKWLASDRRRKSAVEQAKDAYRQHHVTETSPTENAHRQDDSERRHNEWSTVAQARDEKNRQLMQRKSESTAKRLIYRLQSEKWCACSHSLTLRA